MHKKIKGLLDLCRVSNLPTVLSNCIGSWLLAGGAVGELNLLLLVLGSALLYSGGMIMNDVLDVAYDSKFRPERPIPFGTISKRTAGIITLLFIIAGMALMIVGNAHLFFVLSLIAVIGAYNVFHKKWSHSVYLMGACRSILFSDSRSTRQVQN
jgi:4-hydroxybenzoate polyprenyltransferase